MKLIIREAQRNDMMQLFELYTQLHNNSIPIINKQIMTIWNNIMNDKNHHIILGCINEKIITSCVIVIIPNLTNNQHPYALIENVITDINFRKKGYATSILNYAKKVAIENSCYKIMLMTGSKEKSTLEFYKKAGYNCVDKTGFIQWLK